jgi:hypothetical protein
MMSLTKYDILNIAHFSRTLMVNCQSFKITNIAQLPHLFGGARVEVVKPYVSDGTTCGKYTRVHTYQRCKSPFLKLTKLNKRYKNIVYYDL